MGMRKREGCSPSRTTMSITTGMSAPMAPLALMRGQRSATATTPMTRSRLGSPRDHAFELLADPCGDARGLEPRGHDEERGHEDHDRVAEAAEDLIEREEPRGVERERAAHRHHHERQPVPDEGRDRGEHDREKDGDVAHPADAPDGGHQKPQIIGTQKTATTKNHSMNGRPNFQ